MTSTPLLMRHENGNKNSGNLNSGNSNSDPRKQFRHSSDQSGKRQVNVVHPISKSGLQNENVLKRSSSGQILEVPLSPLNQVHISARAFQVQLKPLYVISLRQVQTDCINRLIATAIL